MPSDNAPTNGDEQRRARVLRAGMAEKVAVLPFNGVAASESW